MSVLGDPGTLELTLRTLRVGVESTVIAAIPGVPAGALLGLGRFRGRGPVLGVFNAGLRVPPVALGLILWLFMWPDSQWGGGPLGGLNWLYTLNAAILAQVLLVLPIIVALTAAAVQSVPEPLLAQARAFGARTPAVAQLALREARVGVFAALIAALGSAMAAVGAVLLVGGGDGGTLPAAALNAWNGGGRNADAVVYGTIALALFLIVAAVLTTIQHGQRPRWLPVRS